jgi:hypothetical protein
MFGASTPFCLTTPPTPTLFGVFTFHRRSPFITGVCTPSIRCLYNSSSFHPCMHWKGLRLLFSLRAQETSYCTQFFTVSALSFIWEHFFSLHLLSHCSTSLDHRYSCTICVPSCNFYSPDFSIFLAYV